jgi:hypothetical protein
VKRRKGAVFGMVCLAALVATGANVLSAAAYLRWKSENSSCADPERLVKLGLNRRAESILKAFARDAENHLNNNEIWDISVRAEGRALVFGYRFKKPVKTDVFNRALGGLQKNLRDTYCASGSWLLRALKATETVIYYSPEGERLSSFSIAPADCQQW